ncbi:hypothetical protein [Neorhizobium sp. NCHU2750]|uniref:hypothetical protein n=1 Tax=Neorhizobium sp. NCHU2750 TaxID=1825976 RepID=UPI0013C515BB
MIAWRPARAARRVRRHARPHAVQFRQIAFVTSRLGNARSKLVLVGHPAVVSDEIGTGQFYKRPADKDRTREIGKAIRRGDHAEDQIIDAGDGQAVRAFGKLHPRKIGGGCCHVRLEGGGHAAAL